MEDHLYSVKYKVETGEFSRDQLNQGGAGGCDQLGLISVVGKFGEGDLSIARVSVHDDGTVWTDSNWFQVWSIISYELANSQELDAEQKQIATEAFERVRSMVLRNRMN